MPIHRLVLWNIDLTLVDVAKVSRVAFAAAFRAVTGRPLVKLPLMAGRSEPEIFFEALALNGVDLIREAASAELLAPFSAQFAAALTDQRDQLTVEGRLLPGVRESMARVAKLKGVIPSSPSRCLSFTPSAWRSTPTRMWAGSAAPSPTPREP
jgi:phosphoglycolate phosphatase